MGMNLKNLDWMKILSVAMTVSMWAGSALKDEKVTSDEINDLIKLICGVFGVTPEIRIPMSGTE